MASEFSICILAGERPINAASFGIALALPAIDFAPRSHPVHQSSPKALTIQDADFDLRHVQPARMLGCVVKLYASQQRASGRRTENLLEAGAEMGVEVVQNQVNLSGGGITALKQVLYEGDEFRLGSALGDLDHPTPAFGLAGAGVLCVITMMIVVTYEVISRYLLNAPTTWSDEIASYLLIAIVFLGLAQNLRLGDHIRIDIVTNLVSAGMRPWLDLFAYAVGLVFSIMLLVGTWIRFHNFWMRNTASDSPLMTPLWLPMVPVLVGAVIFVLGMLAGLLLTAQAVLSDPRNKPVAPPAA